MCALLGLKVAAGVNDTSAMEKLYLATAANLTNPQSLQHAVLKLRVIYHSVCGGFGEG